MTLRRPSLVAALACCGLACSATGANVGNPTSDGVGDAATADVGAIPVNPDGGNAPATILIFVHDGSPDLAPFRVCIDPAGAPLPSDFSRPMPLANYPGIPVGAAASLGDVDDKIMFNVTLVDALALANAQSDPRSKSCNALSFLGTAASEAITAPVVLTMGMVNVAVVQGSAGSRTVKVVTLDATAPADKTTRLQWGQFAAGAGTLSATFSKNGSADVPLGAAAQGAVAQGSVQVDFDPGSPPGAFDTSGITVTGAGQPRFFSLSDIQAASDPTSVPTQFFTPRVSFGVLAVGDANLADAGAGQGLHLVAIPAQL